jgi:hypothetical protein
MNQELILLTEEQEESQWMRKPGMKRGQETKMEGLLMIEELPGEILIDKVTEAIILDEMTEERSGAQERR